MSYSENDLATIVIGESIKVHQTLGPGLLESVYETCLEYRLSNAGLNIQVQKAIPVVYETIKLECGFRCDILVENKLILEIKACEALNDVHLAQVLTYLRLSNIKPGLLMNFNVLKVKDGIRRIASNL